MKHGLNTDKESSREGAKVATGLPDYVQPFHAAILEENARIGFTCDDPTLDEDIAWNRWAKSLTNRELAEFAMFIRCELVQPGNNPLGKKLEEIWRRLKAMPSQPSPRRGKQKP